MELNCYQTCALETATYPATYRIIYPSLGMNGEAGEVADKVKKLLRDHADLPRTADGAIIVPSDVRPELAKEVGDVLWYVAVMAADLGYSLDEVARMNLEKLASRKQRGVLGGSGDNR